MDQRECRDREGNSVCQTVKERERMNENTEKGKERVRVKKIQREREDKRQGKRERKMKEIENEKERLKESFNIQQQNSFAAFFANIYIGTNFSSKGTTLKVCFLLYNAILY